jgi:hypothetical protein
VILNRELTEKILGKDMSQCQKLAEEAKNYDIIEREIADRIIAHPLQVLGNAFSDEYGMTLIAKEATEPPINFEKEADDLLRELEQ